MTQTTRDRLLLAVAEGLKQTMYQLSGDPNKGGYVAQHVDAAKVELGLALDRAKLEQKLAEDN